jgi:pyrroline-5-carboxylate reductase
MSQYKIAFVGTGVMAGAMLRQALQAGCFAPGEVIAYDRNPQAAGCFGVAVAASAAEACASADTVQLGVKPQDQPALLQELGLALQEKLVISIAAGVPLAKIAPSAPKAVRLMPNINATIGKSVTAYCATQAVLPQELAFVAAYCGSFSCGSAIALEEKHFSAFCALAGSAPAFVYIFIDELARAGVSAGLPKALALQIAAQTTLGSAALVQQSSAHPYELADRVCSPGGTTIAGINALRANGFAHGVSQAVLAAYQRDQALGK